MYLQVIVILVELVLFIVNKQKYILHCRLTATVVCTDSNNHLHVYIVSKYIRVN